MYYTYRCTQCKHEFDVSKGQKESVVLIACPKCGNTSCKRKWSAPPTHYKGSGFYVTDK